ncbi:hypothetical protein [Microbacterium sp. 3J1]|uniref:hypothetical protein n=1 Tax=Microbacterium sp. 3J1 TaxID=861269 RepID=UPI000B1B74D8|nr:hypothetical protein [Microbacterium sp. 3J1]
MSIEFRDSGAVTIHENDSAELVEVATRIKALRDTAKQSSQYHGRELDAISRDPNLSDQGKKERTADLEAHHKTQRHAAMAQEKQIINDKITTLERRLDGFVGYSSENVMAFRDAQDRAESIEDADKAATVMARALRTNDTTLAHAIYRRAVNNGWAEASRAFAAQNPTVAALVKDVRTLEKLRDAGFNRAVAYM